ncbi:ABC transporter substrate-binding protein [Pseudoruegeria sp. SK021]|uniref:ABC transporter substrate-binding protein n=1 Tax=Pseudoruegeria sp. SK021 TaxID=1933035 RepID=UPI000A257E15|nr:ABC transporter substrate-binding protein [Pseudoruegeria sp. SK021]OSP53471.1 hypothetical protein BV911_17835 [Pseudoruegeria sp. SK021]
MSPLAHSLTRRGFLSAAAATGALTAFAGRPAFAQGSELVVAVQGLPDSLITGFSSFASLSVVMQMLEALVARRDDGSFAPGLASSWEPESEDTWLIHLREGVTFHDGMPFTAEDVKFTLDYVLDPENNYGSRARISQITSVEVVDDLTVRLGTDGPFPTLINGLSNVVMEPKHYVEAVGRDGMTAKPIGTGPFVLDEWTPGDRITFSGFAEYWGGTPLASRLTLRQVPEGSTRVASLMAGEVAISEEMPIDLLEVVDASDKAMVDAVESTVGLLLTFDTSVEELKDPRVRQALNYAVDKQTILDRLLMGRGTVLQGQMLTSNTFGFNADLEPFSYDPEKAKALLAEAGYSDGFETSITTRSGKYLADVDICNVIAAMFSDIGVITTVNVVEQGVYSKMATAHDMGPMHMVGWYSLGDADFATVWFTQGSGRAYWENEEYEKEFVAGRSTVDEEARLAAYHRMTEIMHEECPAVFLFGLPTVYGKSSDLEGWTPPSDKILRLHGAARS